MVPLEIDVRVPTGLVRRVRRMMAVHEALKIVVGPLQECKLKGFLVKNEKLVERRCIPLLVKYYCVIPDGRTFRECDMVLR